MFVGSIVHAGLWSSSANGLHLSYFKKLKTKIMKKESLSVMTVKTLLAVVIFTGIGTIIIGGGYIIGEYSKNRANNKITEPVDQEIENCAKEGESVGSCVGCKKCCQGLQPMDYLKYNSECVDSPTPGGGVCSNCGNGICEKENNEDECNCSEDCGEIKIPDWAIYKNEKLGITFKHQNWWVESRTEKDFKNIIIEQNNTIKSITTPGSLITVFEKSKNETIEEAIEKIIKKEGVDLGDCKILVTEQYKQGDNIIASILLKENYEPSDDEIMAKIGNVDSVEDLNVICKTTPECEWAKQILIEEKTKTKCSQYAKCFGYKCGSNFIYQSNNSEEKFIYIQLMASTPSFWEWNSIEILKDQINTSNWQTYRNEEFGFEFKYPEDWIKKNIEDVYFAIQFRKDISFDHPRRFTEINININKNSKNLSLEEIISDFENSGRIYEQKEYIAINDKKVFKAEIANWGMVSGKQFLIVGEKYWHDIVVDGTNVEDNEIDQILSTFKFIEK